MQIYEDREQYIHTSCEAYYIEYAGLSEAVIALGVEYATAQCSELLKAGAPGIHFYTLNKSPATRQIMTALRNEGLL